MNFFFGCESQWVCNLWQFFCFNFVQFVIIVYQQCNLWEVVVFNCFNQQSFNCFFNWQIELFNQFCDGFCVWCINQCYFLGSSSVWFFWCDSFCQFNVCCIVRGVGEDYIVFIVLCQYLEFVRGVVVDRIGVGLYGVEIQFYVVEDFVVGCIYCIVGFLQGFLRSMERVSIFYQEFVGMYDVEMWMYFVVEFGLDLIEVQWQLFVRVKFVMNQVSDNFFMSWVEYEWMFVMVNKMQQFWIVLFLMIIFLL